MVAHHSLCGVAERTADGQEAVLPTETTMTEKHTAYVEVLAHVNCGECGMYWGLSDISADELTGRDWVCTHCGHATTIGTVHRKQDQPGRDAGPEG